MDVIQFQEKLRDICELGKQNGNMLTHEQIREHFASTDLETSQMLKVLQYLKLQGIMIEGDTAPVETEEVGETEPESKGTSTPLTSEEEAYLKDYLAEVSNGKEVSWRCFTHCLRIWQMGMPLQRQLLPAFICR